MSAIGARIVKAELPGLKVDDVGIHVEKGVLTLRGVRKLEKRDDKERYCHIEHLYRAFARSFAIPDAVDPEKIDIKAS